VTQIKTNRGKVWFEPALWMKAEHFNFNEVIVRVNKRIYRSRTVEFVKAYEDDRIIRMLRE